MVPASGTSKPAMSRSRVVLPEPDGPNMVKNSPREMSRSTSRTAAWEPKRLVTPRSTIPWSWWMEGSVDVAVSDTARAPPFKHVGRLHLQKIMNWSRRGGHHQLRRRELMARQGVAGEEVKAREYPREHQEHPSAATRSDQGETSRQRRGTHHARATEYLREQAQPEQHQPTDSADHCGAAGWRRRQRRARGVAPTDSQATYKSQRTTCVTRRWSSVVLSVGTVVERPPRAIPTISSATARANIASQGHAEAIEVSGLTARSRALARISWGANPP